LGPRHFAFHPGGKYGFGLNEMGSRVTAFGYRDGVLQERQTISTIPSDLKTENNSAEIEVDQAGRFVYASNRGDDSIAVFVIDAAKGTLTNVQRVPTQGKNPRNFKLAPGGKYLLAANQNSDSVVAFSRDAKSGKLTPAGQVLDIPSPVCIQFVRK
jgi:6-phosphogluconolactonase